MATQAAETRSLSLYEIADEVAQIEEHLVASEGVLDENTEAMLERLEGQFDDKVERICAFRQNMLRTAQAFREEEDRLASRRRTFERSAASLRDYLARELEHVGRGRMEVGTFRLRFQRNPASVDLAPGFDVPEEYRRVTVALDKRAALEALKRLRQIPEEVGTHEVGNGLVVKRTASLRIE